MLCWDTHWKEKKSYIYDDKERQKQWQESKSLKVK